MGPGTFVFHPSIVFGDQESIMLPVTDYKCVNRDHADPRGFEST